MTPTETNDKAATQDSKTTMANNVTNTRQEEVSNKEASTAETKPMPQDAKGQQHQDDQHHKSPMELSSKEWKWQHNLWLHMVMCAVIGDDTAPNLVNLDYYKEVKRSIFDDKLRYSPAIFTWIGLD